jgi:primosomal protein N' (replication factor Y)
MEESRQNDQRIADVAVNIRALGLKTFKYKMPDELADQAVPGSPVVVEFNNREVFGYVIGYSGEEPDSKYNILPIKAVLDSSPIPHNLLSLAKWMAKFYGSSLAESVKLITPPGSSLSIKQKFVFIKENDGSLTSEAAELLFYLKEKKPKLADIQSSDKKALDSLLKKGFIKQEYELTYKKISGKRSEKNKIQAAAEEISSVDLNLEQLKSYQPILEAIQKDAVETFVLRGVTGSGKTEIYIKAAQETLKKGGGAIILVPEIALTPQLKKLFVKRFGDKVAVMHSGLTMLARFKSWQLIAKGEINLVVGTRTALFAPLKNCKLIVVDEEHETTYKNNRSPRYHVRDVSIERSRIDKAVLIFGSATPSLDAVGLVKKANIVSLDSRFSNQPLPEITVVNMKQSEDRACLSPILKKALLENSEKGYKSLLFLNRRGFSKFLICGDCGFVPTCKKCAVSLTYHLDRKLLHCHHCGYFERAKPVCSRCGSHKLIYKGIGTERVEGELKQLLPKAKVVRMDADTTMKRGSHERLLKEFDEDDGAVLIGTQMIAKGLHFPEVALVGIINADTALYLPDFRSAERTFQLLVQAAGRTGRGSLPGQVILQTYNPEHYSIQNFIDYEYDNFWSIESAIRREVNYPPHCSLVNIVIASVDQGKAADIAQKLADVLRKGKTGAIEILGAVPSPIYMLKGKFRWHILVKFGNEQIFEAADILNKYIDDVKITGVSVILDVNPAWLL